MEKHFISWNLILASPRLGHAGGGVTLLDRLAGGEEEAGEGRGVVEEGEELAVWGLQALGPTQIQGEDVVNNALNAVSTSHALTGAGHGRLRLLMDKKLRESFEPFIFSQMQPETQGPPGQRQ